MIKYELEEGDVIIRGVDSPNDVIYTSDTHGAFNVGRAMLWAIDNTQPVDAQMSVAHVLAGMMNIDLDAEHLIALNDVSDQTLDRITVLLYIDLGDGTHMLIDGNHRLAAKASRAGKAGKSFIVCAAFVISLEEAQRFRVRYFSVIDGQENEIDPSAMLDKMRGVYSKPDGSFEDRRTSS